MREKGEEKLAWWHLRWGRVVFYALLVFFLLSGGNYLYKTYYLGLSLTRDLVKIPGVEKATLDQTKEGLTVVVDLGEVSCLQETYQEVASAVQARFPSAKISLKDKRNPELVKLCREIQFAVEEAIACGNFRMLPALLTEKAEAAHLKNYGMTIDSENIYLQLHDQKGYLYAVFPRQQGEGKRPARVNLGDSSFFTSLLGPPGL